MILENTKSNLEKVLKYSIDYQYMAKGAARPSDDGEVVKIEATDKSGTVIIPNVVDYVHIDTACQNDPRTKFSGKVRSRLFSYARLSKDDNLCLINIVVEETDDNWSKLIKE
jgi:hypothetical protein